MAIKVKFFASLREQQPDGLNEIDATGIQTINDVWRRATSTELMPDAVLCSVNLEHREPHETVKDGDEVAFGVKRGRDNSYRIVAICNIGADGEDCLEGMLEN